MFNTSPQKGKIIGSFIGLMFGGLYLKFGLWNTLILFSLTLIGFVIGKFYDDRAEIFSDDED